VEGPAVKNQPPTVVLAAENDRLRPFVNPNVAVLVGTVAGVQLAAPLKSAVPAMGPLTVGLELQVASWAAAGKTVTSSAANANSPARNEAGVRRARNPGVPRRSTTMASTASPFQSQRSVPVRRLQQS
jgi:hypothetical protein